MENAKIRINIQTGDIEFEGTEEFVREQVDNLEQTLEKISNLGINTVPEPEEEEINTEGKNEENGVTQADGLDTSCSFGEWLHKFKDNVSDADKTLITGYYIQKRAQDNQFKTKHITDVLKEQGIKLSNASTSLKQITKRKFMIINSKKGILIFRRVTPEGIKYLRSLLR